MTLRELLKQARPADIEDGILHHLREAMRRDGITGQLEGSFALCLVRAIRELLDEID